MLSHAHRCCGTLALLGPLLAGAPAALAAPVFSDAFETPTVTSGLGFDLYNPPTALGPWTVTGTSSIALLQGSFTAAGVAFPAVEGTAGQWVDLTSIVSGGDGGVETTIATVAGQTYAISFHVGNINDATSTFGTSSTVQVYADGMLVSTAVNDGGVADTLTWEAFEFSFTATDGFTTFRFTNADPVGDNVNGLDAVSIRTVDVTAVPEPTGLALALAGLAALRGSSRRRARG